MSGGCQCEGHAQFHRRKPLKAFSQSDSPTPPSGLFPSLCFPLELPPFNSKLFSFPLYTLRCFHYANTKLVAGLAFLSTFLDGKWDWGSSPAILQLALMRNWFLEISSITDGQDNLSALQNTREIVNFVWKKRTPNFLSSCTRSYV